MLIKNSARLIDNIFFIYRKLPHCIYFRRKHIREARRRIEYAKLKDVSIFAPNCVGGEICSLLGLPFNSPLINTLMNRHEYIILCEHLGEYLAELIHVKKTEDGKCIGTIGSGSLPLITISFPHDNNPKEVERKWLKRCKRVNFERLIYITDDIGMKEEDFDTFDRIPAFGKVCLASSFHGTEYDWIHLLNEYSDMEHVGGYYHKSLDGLWRFVNMWDYVGFLLENT